MVDNDFYIVAMGASLGGINAFSMMAADFPQDFPAPVFIVQHNSGASKNYLVQMLAGKGPLEVAEPSDGEEIKPGIIYIARPNHHLLIKNGYVITPYGPRENRFRPAIDVLFRSAAAVYTTKVVAVLLTGYLDDGVSGLSAVKRCGGTVIVQDPDEAEIPDMPKNAIENVAVDHILPINEIPEKLAEIVRLPYKAPVQVPEDILEKIRVSEHRVPGIEDMHKIGELTSFTCPECGGTMWSSKDEPLGRFVCHTGHSFTTKSFLAGQAEVLENSLWAALQFMDQRIKLLQSMIDEEQKKGRQMYMDNFKKTQRELEHHLKVIRDFILSGSLSPAGDSAESHQDK